MTRDPGCRLCEQGTGGWTLGFADGDPAAEGTREALLTLGNGYLATRGAKPEAHADGIHYPEPMWPVSTTAWCRRCTGGNGRTRAWSTCQPGPR